MPWSSCSMAERPKSAPRGRVLHATGRATPNTCEAYNVCKAAAGIVLLAWAVMGSGMPHGVDGTAVVLGAKPDSAHEQPFGGTEASEARRQLAREAAAKSRVAGALSPGVAGALETAAAKSVVNPQDARIAIDTLLQSLLPWYSRNDDSDTQENLAEIFPQAGSALARISQRPKPSGTCCQQLANSGWWGEPDTTDPPVKLPVVIVDTRGAVVPLRSSVPAAVCACMPPERSSPSFENGKNNKSKSDWEGMGEIKVRGSSSAVQMVKKSFGLTLRSGKFTGLDSYSASSSKAPRTDNSTESQTDDRRYRDAAPSSAWEMGEKLAVPLLGERYWYR
jgi:hypothetical protein